MAKAQDEKANAEQELEASVPKTIEQLKVNFKMQVNKATNKSPPA